MRQQEKLDDTDIILGLKLRGVRVVTPKPYGPMYYVDIESPVIQVVDAVKVMVYLKADDEGSHIDESFSMGAAVYGYTPWMDRYVLNFERQSKNGPQLSPSKRYRIWVGLMAYGNTVLVDASPMAEFLSNPGGARG